MDNRSGKDLGPGAVPKDRGRFSNADRGRGRGRGRQGISWSGPSTSNVGKPLLTYPKWYVLLMDSIITDKEIKDFEFRLTHELRQKNATFSLSRTNQVLIRETDVEKAIQKLCHKFRDEESFELCLIIGALPHNVAEIENQLQNIIPIIHVENFSSDTISEVADKIKSLKSNQSDVETKAAAASSSLLFKKPNVVEAPPPNNFRNLTIFPSQDEILMDEKPYLRANIVNGAYESVEHYLDIQFRLLREDYIEPLRKGINYYLRVVRGENIEKKRLEIKIYDKVTISPPERHKWSGLLTYRLKFDVSDMKKVRWETSKHFKFGSLLCLSSDNFKTNLFATVNNRNPEDLKKGEFDAEFELLPNDKLELRDVYQMAESSVYFEAYRHVLLALLAIKDERDMPFPKYFVSCDPMVDSPLYLRAVNFSVDLTCLLPEEDQQQMNGRHLVTNISNPSMWPTKETLRLDQAQYDALRLALTKELAVIQGPPGTGKTFIGWKIVQVLLANVDQWQKNDDRTPILVVCYTNHALDQFLEGISKFMSEGIIRIGGGCKNQAMAKYLLRNVYYLYKLRDDLRGKLQIQRRNTLATATSVSRLSKLVQSLDKSPLDHASLSEVVENKQLLNQIFANPNSWTTLENELKIWLTSKTQNQNPTIDVETLRQLMMDSYFNETPCVNALWMMKNDYNKAFMFLNKNQLDPKLYKRFESVKNFPPIEIVDTMVQQLRCSENDAVFALQQNGNDLHAAIQWLTEGPETIEEEEIFDEHAAFKAAAIVDTIEDDDEVVDLEVLDGETPEVDDDDESESLNTLLQKIMNSDFCGDGVDVVNKNNKNQFPQCVWDKIIKSKPFNEDEYKRFIDEDQPVDVWKLSLQDRWRLYKTWLEKFRSVKEEKIHHYRRLYLDIMQRMKELRCLEQQHIFKQAKVLGMTTTGAAKYQAVLNEVKPKIVVVEEAAQVLESHIVTSLSAGCQHVILIGDHHQLRPWTAVYDLANKYSLNVSLFERLINNKFKHVVLKQQHRMRPEIADSLMPYFYKDLENHESVLQFENVKGVSKNLFFFHHNDPEQRESDSTSWQNEFEGKMIVGFLKYLLQQGYNTSDVTILCCYAGQVFFIKKYMQLAMLPEETTGLRVTAVDNYQGEECDIIILSLVRSNNDQKIGFLKIKNRVCVALSRAKNGLYCFGDFDHLSYCSPDLWKEITDNIKSKNFYGQTLPLVCQIHKTEALVKNFEDFEKFVPEGGCKKFCNYRMDCGHVCRKYCHPTDAEHKNVRCMNPCERKCPEGHSCQKQCCERCGDCKTLVDKVLPLCGHSNRVHCSKPLHKIKCEGSCSFKLLCGHKCQDTCDPLDHTKYCKKLVEKELRCGHRMAVKCFQQIDEVSCTTEVTKTWPYCQHTEQTQCFVDVNETACNVLCNAILDCEHKCTGDCSSCRNGRLHVQCKEYCTKILICGHECGQECTISCPPCEKPCEMRCIHSKCTIVYGKNKEKGRKCGLPCPDCVEKCGWTCEHHKCTKKCSEICDRPRCNENCKKLLKCGHPCIGICGEPCLKICSQCDADKFKELQEILFGFEDDPEARFLQLPDCGHIFESVGFDNYVDHSSRQSSEGDEADVKLLLCPKCNKPILTCQRYGNILKAKFSDVQIVKRKIHGDFEELDRQQKELIAQIDKDVHFKSLQTTKKFQDVFEELKNYLNNNSVKMLSKEKLIRMTNFIGFLKQLVNLNKDIDKRLWVGREGRSPILIPSPVMIKFLKQWCQCCFSGKSMTEMKMYIFIVKENSKLLEWILNNYKIASKQMMEEFSCELLRFQYLIEVFVILKAVIKKNTAIAGLDELEEIFKILYGSQKVDNKLGQKCITALKSLQKKFNLVLNITEEERKEILIAMNMRQGHWFKCKNGHIYCITECGGAMEEANCPECDARIGGSQHRVMDDNEVATEMDGAVRSAFDEQAANDNLDMDLVRRLQLE